MSDVAIKKTRETFGGTIGLAWVLILGGITGWIGAFALTLERLHVAANPDAVLSCDLNTIISCKSVMLSHQAKLFGFPNPLIGLSAFMFPIAVGVAVLAGARFTRWFWNTFMVGITLGFTFVIWLAYQAIFEIGALCPYCMVAWAGTIPMFWHLWTYLTAEDIIPVPIRTIGFFERTRNWAWVFTLMTEVILIAIIVVKFWSQWAQMFGWN
ncbi:MAG: vitamin K epoxide reductase family protein [Actinomycetales bacterium]|nr:vitamin K epoxide reductase family protein [Actinomycetales bacterium]